MSIRIELKNYEGYNDPTAYEALNNILQEEKAKEVLASVRIRQNLNKPKSIVYICSPIEAYTPASMRQLLKYRKFALQSNSIPIVTTLLLDHSLVDDKDAPRVRLIVPLTRDVSPDEYAALARYFVSEIDIDGFDECSYRAHQLMYWPTTPSNGEYVFRRYDGEWLDPDTYLHAHPNWHDCSQLPTSSRESKVVDRSCKHQQDPLEKPGIIGAFCRTYSISAAIDKFLSDVYTPSLMDGRYDYIPADSQAGVVLYDDKYAYSHHASDPACGKLLNAFDIVRIHRFGDLDSNSTDDVEPARLPSFKAMQDFAVQDEEVKATLAAERMSDAEIMELFPKRLRISSIQSSSF